MREGWEERGIKKEGGGKGRRDGKERGKRVGEEGEWEGIETCKALDWLRNI